MSINILYHYFMNDFLFSHYIMRIMYLIVIMVFLKSVDDFIEDKKNSGWSDRKLKRIRLRLVAFEKEFSEEAFSLCILEKWERILEQRGLSERTIAEYLTVARQFLVFSGYPEIRFRKKNTLDLRGRQFGELEVLEPCEKRSKERSILWKCRCSCGKIVELPANELTKGLHTSCGCKKAERLKESNQCVDGTSLKMIFSDTIRRDNSSGYKGVYWKKDRWAVRIQYKGKRYYLGSYDRLDEAVRVRKEAEEKIREEAREQYLVSDI